MSFDCIQSVLDVSVIDGGHDRDVFRVMSKLTEECGEAATIINKPNEKHAEGLNGEVADVILAAVDLLYVHVRDALPNLSHEDAATVTKTLLEKSIKKKVSKWREKYFNE